MPAPPYVVILTVSRTVPRSVLHTHTYVLTNRCTCTEQVIRLPFPSPWLKNKNYVLSNAIQKRLHRVGFRTSELHAVRKKTFIERTSCYRFDRTHHFQHLSAGMTSPCLGVRTDDKGNSATIIREPLQPLEETCRRINERIYALLAEEGEGEGGIKRDVRAQVRKSLAVLGEALGRYRYVIQLKHKKPNTKLTRYPCPD